FVPVLMLELYKKQQELKQRLDAKK
ncbi:MAG: hypothetical protein PWQ76_966, partial [Clostridiales bacterium]|nr:hypothetical protein [Clostridiales bacterium]